MNAASESTHSFQVLAYNASRVRTPKQLTTSGLDAATVCHTALTDPNKPQALSAARLFIKKLLTQPFCCAYLAC